MESNKLIYDLGFHQGEDSFYYLTKGYNVIAVEANPALVEQAKIKYKAFIKSGQLRIINCAISDKDGDTILFHISEKSAWSSLDIDKTERFIKSIPVKSRKLSSLIEEFGIPFFCKIDIEGYDLIALQSLFGNVNLRPQYISAEMGKILSTDRAESLILSNWLEIPKALKDLGYKKFKIVDQATLKVIQPGQNFYDSFYTQNKLIKKFYNKFSRINVLSDVWSSFIFNFLTHSSGPFAENLRGEWLSYEELMKLIPQHLHNLATAGISDMWCDVHATS